MYPRANRYTLAAINMTVNLKIRPMGSRIMEAYTLVPSTDRIFQSMMNVRFAR